MRNTIDSIFLKDIDDSNEWLTRRIEEDELDEFSKVDLAFDDDILTWGSVARAFGVEEERFNLRSRMRPPRQATGSSSSSQHAPHDGDEDDEENMRATNLVMTMMMVPCLMRMMIMYIRIALHICIDLFC